MEVINEIKDQITSSRNKIIGSPINCDGSQIIFHSTDCTVELEDNLNLRIMVQFFAPGGYLKIGSGGVIRGSMMVGRDAKIIIGDRLDVTSGLEIITDDGATVKIGDDCLFAKNVNLRSYDNHPIYDLDSKKRINYAKPIEIGERVWIGADVAVLGGSKISSGSVIGTKSLVTQSHPVPRNSIAAGNPVRVIRENICWRKPGRNPLDVIPDEEHARFL